MGVPTTVSLGQPDPTALSIRNAAGEEIPLEIWDINNPASVINLLPPSVRALLTNAKEKVPHLLDMDERVLWKELRSQDKSPSVSDSRLRMKFWNEYERAAALGERMNLPNIYLGVCSPDYFQNRYILMPEKVAWMLCPPASYVVKMEEALAYGVEQLRDILELPLVDAKGRPDMKLAELKAKIVAMLDIRVKGAIVQKVENKTTSLNINTTDKQVAKAMLFNSMEDIERRMKELDKKDRLAAIRVDSTVLEDAGIESPVDKDVV